MSNFYARIRGRDVPLANLKLTIKHNSIGDAQLVVPLAPLVNDNESFEQAINLLTLEDWAVYHNGRLLREGYIKDARFAEHNGVSGFAALFCEDGLGRLRNTWRKPDAQYQNRSFLDALADLLLVQPGWIWNDTTTYPTHDVTLNVRDRDTLWSQIIALVESNPENNIRYGGRTPDGLYMLDFGELNRQNNQVFAIQGVNLISAKSERRPFRKIKRLQPVGGDMDSGAGLELAGTETTDPDYPIILDTVTSKYYINNNNLTAGIDLLENYPDIEPVASPSAGQLAQARQALYSRALRDMQNAENSEILTLDMVLPELPQISDAIYVNSVVDERITDAFTERVAFRPSRYINGFYRITQIEINAKDGISPQTVQDMAGLQVSGLRMTIQCTNAQDIPQYKPEIALVKKAIRRRKQKGPATVTPVGTYTQTVTHNLSFSDYEAVAGFRGKLFVFADPAPPGAVYKRSRIISVTPSSVVWEYASYDSTPAGPVVLGVSAENGQDWDLNSSASIQMQFHYYN